MSDTKPKFRGGRNVAMKLPPHQYEAMVKKSKLRGGRRR